MIWCSPTSISAAPTWMKDGPFGLHTNFFARETFYLWATLFWIRLCATCLSRLREVRVRDAGFSLVSLAAHWRSRLNYAIGSVETSYQFGMRRPRATIEL